MACLAGFSLYYTIMTGTDKTKESILNYQLYDATNQICLKQIAN